MFFSSEKDVIETEDSLPFISKTQTVAASTMAHLPVQLTADISLTSSLANSTTSSNDENDSASSQMNVKVERIYSESIHKYVYCNRSNYINYLIKKILKL